MSPGHQAPFPGISGGFPAILQLKLVEDIVDVVLDRLHLDTQMNGDLFVAEPPLNQSDNLPLPPRQTRVVVETGSAVSLRQGRDP